MIIADLREADSVRSMRPLGGSVEETLLVVVSEEVCLGCLNLGWFIREFRRTIHDNITVVAPGSVEDVARDFIVREKAGAALALVEDTAVVQWQPLYLPVVIDVAADGSIRGVHSSGDLPRLLRLLEDVARSPSTPQSGGSAQ
ncbi:MAG: hypothetical protein OXI83_09230 [Gemmatimonadota bacterium]|nr:hypothetical protein [Gemmatimonadota bacterium]